jgi:hypothetical protein
MKEFTAKEKEFLYKYQIYEKMYKILSLKQEIIKKEFQLKHAGDKEAYSRLSELKSMDNDTIDESLPNRDYQIKTLEDYFKYKEKIELMFDDLNNFEKNNKQEILNYRFVQRATEKYGDRFTYDNLIFKNMNTQVTITCPLHGDFNKTPSNFLQGYYCPKCKKQDKAKKSKQLVNDMLDNIDLIIEKIKD